MGHQPKRDHVVDVALIRTSHASVQRLTLTFLLKKFIQSKFTDTPSCRPFAITRLPTETAQLPRSTLKDLAANFARWVRGTMSIEVQIALFVSFELISCKHRVGRH